MQDKLKKALSTAQAIQADVDAAGMGKPTEGKPRTYSIGGVTFDVSRPLPDKVREYIAQWANDPIWDIDELIDEVGDADLAEYKPELLAYAAAYEPTKEAEWEAKIENVTNLRAIKIAYLRGDSEGARTRAAIAQVEQLKRIADALHTPGYDGDIVSVAYILEEFNQNINRAAIY